ncbi:MAG: epimerase [Pseudomonadota bacterium]
MAGATGLVGRAVLARLLADKAYSAVHCVGRRAPDVQHPKLVAHITDSPGQFAAPPVDDVFIALGTTIKVAGSREAFRAVDFDAVVAIAKAGRALAATRLGVVSAMGADSRSSVFYSRVKGDMETAVAHLGFTSVVIARPSLLAGDRASLRQAQRFGEKLALATFKWLNPMIPANYRSVQASQVAHALVDTLQSAGAGHHLLLSGDLQKYS